ncbi:MAG: hypothetical protein OEQ29_11845, partial [Alphaproteobacteria bacterium]|nr:hypothetical protein [Alphaproteobacteria bacterium]
PTTYELEPDEPQIRAVIEEVQVHPEFALSRREIIRYILAEPNKRAADVQELLRLSEIELTRRALTTVANEARGDKDASQQNLNRARKELMQSLQIEEFNPADMLKVINANREILGLPPLEKLEAKTAFKEGVPAGPKADEASVNKAQTTADIDAVVRLSGEGEDQECAKKRLAALSDLENLIADAALLRTIKQQSLVKAGMDLVDGDNCPLCDKDWKREDLLLHLTQKLESAKEASALLAELSSNLNYVIGEIGAHTDVLGRIVTATAKLNPAPDTEAIDAYKDGLESVAQTLSTFVAETSEVETAKDTLKLDWWSIPIDAKSSIDACAVAISKLPDISNEEKARDLLTRAEEQYRMTVNARSECDQAEIKSACAALVLEVYQTQKDAILEALYNDVAADFTEYYRSLNREDEGEFEGRLIPSAAKLGFHVDFYGYGDFPPGAYHSEGHQDGMGLCLYLALMKRTLGDKYTFSVLDDVLMSIDADHRRQVCKLLMKEFPNTQFILTTHDRVWLKFMQTEALIKNSQTFGGWTVESGPQVWRQLNVWDGIEESLCKDDVKNAADLLRHYLEYIGTVQADALRADVRFRGDGQYTLEDLMPRVISRWRKKIADAIKAAKSWDDDKDVARLTDLLSQIVDAQERAQTERWTINSAVHYNAWANFTPNEFRPVAKAFSDVLDTMVCTICGSFAELQPRHSTADSIRCNCGKLFINLKTSPIP